jgi:hypothetical protein
VVRESTFPLHHTNRLGPNSRANTQSRDRDGNLEEMRVLQQRVPVGNGADLRDGRSIRFSNALQLRVSNACVLHAFENLRWLYLHISATSSFNISSWIPKCEYELK